MRSVHIARVIKDAFFFSYSDGSGLSLVLLMLLSIAAWPFLVGLPPSAVLSFEEDELSRFDPFIFSRCWNLTLRGFVMLCVCEPEAFVA